MPYRAAPTRDAESVHVVHPQRAGTAKLFMGMGFLGAFASAVAIAWTHAILIPAVACGAALLLAFLGLDAWFTRVVFTRFAEGTLRIRWSSLFSAFSRREHTYPLADVVDVDVESSEGTSRIVVLIGDERVGLTDSATSDWLGDKADALRTFLRDPALPGGQALRALPPR